MQVMFDFSFRAMLHQIIECVATLWFRSSRETHLMSKCGLHTSVPVVELKGEEVEKLQPNASLSEGVCISSSPMPFVLAMSEGV